MNIWRWRVDLLCAIYTLCYLSLKNNQFLWMNSLEIRETSWFAHSQMYGVGPRFQKGFSGLSPCLSFGLPLRASVAHPLLTVGGRMSLCGTEHGFSVYCLILVHFTLELPQLGKNSGTGGKRLKGWIWVSPQRRGSKGYMVRTSEDPVQTRTSVVPTTAHPDGTPTFLGRSRAQLFNFTHMYLRLNS